MKPRLVFSRRYDVKTSYSARFSAGLLIMLSLSFLAACQPAKTAPTPGSSTPWLEEEVSFSFGSNELYGILTLPAHEGPHPALVIISGSVNLSTGIRNGVASAYQIDHARRMVLDGFAVLRYDPPGVGRSTGEAGFEPLDLRREEAIAAIQYLQSRPQIAADKIGLWGISQGGWVISMTAARYPQDVAFIITVSGAGVSVAEQQVHSIEAESRNAGLSEEEIRKAVLIGRLIIDWQLSDPIFKEDNLAAAQILGEGPWTSFLDLVYEPGEITLEEGLQMGIEILESIQEEDWAQFLYLQELYLPQLESVPPEQIEALRAMAGQTLLEDPRDYMTAVRCPVLAIYGENDLLQPTEKSAVLLEQYLTDGGKADCEIVILPGEGHATFLRSPAYWEPLSDWLKELREDL